MLFYRHLTNTENSAYWVIVTGYEPIKYSSYETELYLDHLNKNYKINIYIDVARVNAQDKIKKGY